MIPINIDLTLDAIDKLPNQFYDKLNIKTLLTVYADKLQESNDQVFNILDSVNVVDASGYLLDCVGSYVAVLRNKDDDEAYRERIRRKILSATSEGTPNDLLQALAFITKGEVNIWEHYPVSTILSTRGGVIPNNLPNLLAQASPASSGEIVVLLNPRGDSFIPSELGFEVVRLADSNLDKFITSNNEGIIINNLIFGGVDEIYARLSEFTYGQGSGEDRFEQDGVGFLCELAYFDGGVQFYNSEYVSLGDTINNWYFLMNYEVPEEFN